MKYGFARNESEEVRRVSSAGCWSALMVGVMLAGAVGCVEVNAPDEPTEAPLDLPDDTGGRPPAGEPEGPPQITAPSFDLTLAADSFMVQGASASHEVGVTSIEGFTGAVSLSATSASPLGLTLTSSTVTAPGRTALTITAPCNWPPVLREVLVTGTSGTISEVKSMVVRVFPFGSFLTGRASVHVPRAIPDNHVNGAASTLFFDETQNILHMIVEPRITHPRPADLVIDLIPPSGAPTILHNRAAALQPSYTVFAFNTGRPMAGDWKLRVVDWVTGATGTINGWSLRAMVRGLPPPPVAAFSASLDELKAMFTEASTDPQACGGNGEIVSWSWDFGDGATSTARNPRHLYAAPGTYEVTLTVTNGSDIAAQTAQQVTVTELVREEAATL